MPIAIFSIHFRINKKSLNISYLVGLRPHNFRIESAGTSFGVCLGQMDLNVDAGHSPWISPVHGHARVDGARLEQK